MLLLVKVTTSQLYGLQRPLLDLSGKSPASHLIQELMLSYLHDILMQVKFEFNVNPS